MNRTAFLFLAAAAFFAVSCGPTYFSLGVEMRRPSRSGVDLDGKNISVTYLDKGEDSLFISSVAEGFTEALEKDFYAGEQKVGMYSIDAVEGVDYTCRDSMVSLLMDTGVDVAFLFDLPQGFVRRAVQLELEDVDVAWRLHDAIHPSLTLLLLGVDRINADESENQVKRVVEIAFPFTLVLLAAHRVGNVRQESGEQLAERVRFAFP